jgi:acyl-CoA thioesterase
MQAARQAVELVLGTLFNQEGFTMAVLLTQEVIIEYKSRRCESRDKPNTARVMSYD